MTLELPLKQEFRYVHEPLRPGETAIPVLGNADLTTVLRDRILRSRGGAFLVTGFRGVGKSTLVLRALEDLVRAAEAREVIVPVVLSVARAMDTDRLLFAIVRRIFESLNDLRLIERLSPDTRRSLLLAYQRTSLAFKESRSDSRERNATFGVSGGSAMKLVVPSVNMSARRTQSLAVEAQFLAYSETDVEHDLMRIVSLLEREGVSPPVARGIRARLPWLWRGRPLPHIRLAVVLDEIDKLTSDAAGMSAVESLLAGAKNVLTMHGIHFIFVAGPDLHDRVVTDVARGNSIYESVFGWRIYVPCCWQAPDLLLRGVLAYPPYDQEELPDDLAKFRDYLCFKSRGVPRKLLQEFNDFVLWDDDRPVLRVKPQDSRRISFYARLEQMLAEYRDSSVQSAGLFPLAVDEDRRRLGAYYVIDWVLRSEGKSFRARDLVSQEQDADLDPLLHVSQAQAQELLEHLARNRILEVVQRPSATGTMIGQALGAEETIYRLSNRVMDDLLSLADRSESERAALGVPAPVEMAAASRTVIAGRYEIVRRLGEGGMGTVFLGHDRAFDRPVAIKMPPSLWSADEERVKRFRREADITKLLRHPQVVQCYAVVDSDEMLAMILEFIEGRELATLIEQSGPLPANAVADIALSIADALAYLEREGIVRIDLKPGNVIMHPTRGPVLIDFGIAKRFSDVSLTATGITVGTLAWMAPEQLSGMYDHRSDIHALGLIMYYSLTGKPPIHPTGLMPEAVRQLLDQEIPVDGLGASAELRAIIRKATDRSPEERYQHAADLLADLKRTPEAANPPTGPAPMWDPQVDLDLAEDKVSTLWHPADNWERPPDPAPADGYEPANAWPPPSPEPLRDPTAFGVYGPPSPPWPEPSADGPSPGPEPANGPGPRPDLTRYFPAVPAPPSAVPALPPAAPALPPAVHAFTNSYIPAAPRRDDETIGDAVRSTVIALLRGISFRWGRSARS